MEVVVSLSAPPEASKPSSTYETTYVYTGLGRVDTHRKKVILWKRVGDRNFLTELDAPDILPRAYYTEHVRVSVYSEQPRIWKEERCPVDVYFFKQVQQVLTA